MQNKTNVLCWMSVQVPTSLNFDILLLYLGKGYIRPCELRTYTLVLIPEAIDTRNNMKGRYFNELHHFIKILFLFQNTHSLSYYFSLQYIAFPVSTFFSSDDFFITYFSFCSSCGFVSQRMERSFTRS